MPEGVAPVERRRIVVLFTLSGAALGVLLAMLCFSQPGTGKTDIGVGTALLVCGAMFGAWVSAELARLVAARPGAAWWLVAGGVLLLTLLLGSSVGWMAGAVGARNGFEHEALTRRGVVIGGGLGPLVGLLVLAPQWLKRPGESPPAGQ